MHMTGEADGRANRVGVPLVDMSTGLYATIGVLAALSDARVTGEGRHVEVSLFDTALASLNNHGTATTMGGAAPAGPATATRRSLPTSRTEPPMVT